MLDALHSLHGDIGVMIQAASRLIGRVDQMRNAQLNGKIDIATRKDAQGFESIFADIAQIVTDARRDCDEITEWLQAAADRLTGLLSMETALHSELDSAHASTSAAVESRSELAGV
jgi:hypothetical protein